MSSQICIDASLAVKWVLAEEYSELALAFLQDCIDSDTKFVAPSHIRFEVTSVIRNQVYRGNISEQTGKKAFNVSHDINLDLRHNRQIFDEAWRLALTYKRPTTYDSYYLALARLEGCDLWTADRRLINAVKESLPWVKWIGDYVPQKHQENTEMNFTT